MTDIHGHGNNLDYDKLVTGADNCPGAFVGKSLKAWSITVDTKDAFSRTYTPSSFLMLNSKPPGWEWSLPNCCVLCFLPFLVETKKLSKVTLGQNFKPEFMVIFFIKFRNENVQKSLF